MLDKRFWLTAGDSRVRGLLLPTRNGCAASVNNAVVERLKISVLL